MEFNKKTHFLLGTASIFLLASIFFYEFVQERLQFVNDSRNSLTQAQRQVIELKQRLIKMEKLNEVVASKEGVGAADEVVDLVAEFNKKDLYQLNKVFSRIQGGNEVFSLDKFELSRVERSNGSAVEINYSLAGKRLIPAINGKAE